MSDISVVAAETKASFREKKASDFEKKYDKGTYKLIPDIIRPPGPDYDFQESTKPKEDEVMENTEREELKKSKAPTRLENGGL